jgi:hypothetical protein
LITGVYNIDWKKILEKDGWFIERLVLVERQKMIREKESNKRTVRDI